MIYLAEYKDVAFSFAVSGEFCGMFYFAKQTKQPDVQFTVTVVGVLAWMIAINVVCGVTTLIIHWDSAFYTKQRKFRKQEKKLLEERENMQLSLSGTKFN